MSKPLTKAEARAIARAARVLPLAAPQVRFEDFAASELGLSAAERMDYFPYPDPNGLVDKAVAVLTLDREEMLRDESIIPPFVVTRDIAGAYWVCGLVTYLQANSLTSLSHRIAQHGAVRKALVSLERGRHLEALVAAILSRDGTAHATRGSGDQGIDVISWNPLLPLEHSFVDGATPGTDPVRCERVFVLASSKMVEKRGKKGRPSIDPAHIRELVGGWVIQRSPVGAWSSHGIKPLTPVQMLMATTYRLSTNAKAECRKLGVQVWSLPELIYMVCKDAPASVFDAANGHAFVPAAFKSWWRPFDLKRLKNI